MAHWRVVYLFRQNSGGVSLTSLESDDEGEAWEHFHEVQEWPRAESVTIYRDNGLVSRWRRGDESGRGQFRSAAV
jgi:hypothetical protein